MHGDWFHDRHSDRAHGCFPDAERAGQSDAATITPRRSRSASRCFEAVLFDFRSYDVGCFTIFGKPVPGTLPELNLDSVRMSCLHNPRR